MARRRLPRVRLPRLRGPAGIVVALLVVAVAVLTQRHAATGLPTNGVVSRVVDGDTLAVQAGGAELKVRLIGVDTPEVHPSEKLENDARRTHQDVQTITALGRRASEFTRSLCQGKSCRLEYDPANTARGSRDRYGRLLAFVWVPGDGDREVMANGEIIRQGFGRAMTEFAFDAGRQAEFRRLEREARDAGRGLWGEWKP